LWRLKLIIIEISPAEIDLNSLYSRLKNNSHGAVSLFTGKVRDTNNNLLVSNINYDCFFPLAEKALKEICAEALNEWGSDLNIIVFHRTGRLDVGDISVAIGVSAKHRRPALLASQYIINELKHRVPVWKEEVYSDGSRKWLEGCSLQ
jgi:molybdopterin synthase catalytic subunit